MSSESSSDEYASDGEEEITEFSPEFVGAINDQSALIVAAKKSRMPADRPSEHELAFFPGSLQSKTAVNTYLVVRNTILATWLSNQLKECTTTDVLANLNPPFNDDLELVERIVAYLTRFGKINFGHYERTTKIRRDLTDKDHRLVVVIGAGAAGIAAATQLLSFGYDVIIIEARNRVGGRIQTIMSNNGQYMELGGDILRNCESSPLVTLMHQVRVRSYQTFKDTWVYQEGKRLHPAKDALMEKMYTSTVQGMDLLATTMEDKKDEDGLYVSRQQVHENLFSLVERKSMVNFFNYLKNREELAKKCEYHCRMMNSYRKAAMHTETLLNNLPADAEEVQRRILRIDLVEALTKFDKHSAAYDLHNIHLTNNSKNWTKIGQYMHTTDYRVYNFLIGFEEFMYGAQLEKVQFSRTNINKEQGATIRLHKGIADLLAQVTEKQKLDIRLNHRIIDIDYSKDDHVVLTVEDPNEHRITISPAFVVSTLPLGVLKKTIQNDDCAPSFTPNLPEEKVKAIQNIGFGVVNKIVFSFERSFWTANYGNHQFGIIPDSAETRGSMVLWSSSPGTTVISTYLTGDANLHEIPDHLLVSEALTKVKIAFPNCPKEPSCSHVTRWHKDEFAFGTGSFMSLRTEKEDFDTMIKPIKTKDGKNRIYFAGEHTTLKYANSIQGAWISGLLAAADLANDHLGVDFADLVEDPSKPNDEPSTSNKSEEEPERLGFDEHGRRLDMDE